jgi:hypothetical protein
MLVEMTEQARIRLEERLKVRLFLGPYAYALVAWRASKALSISSGLP